MTFLYYLNNRTVLLFSLISFFFSLNALAQPNYDYRKLKTEKLNRGLIALRQDSSSVSILWRYLSTDPMDIRFNVYKSGKKVNKEPISHTTMFVDKDTNGSEVSYELREIIDGMENTTKTANCKLEKNAPIGYLNIPLNKPKEGVTPAGETYSYSPNDASIGDVDGDGEYEIFLKWDPSNAHDNSHDGYTGNVYIDCYKLNGEQLWRVDLGKNIRAGAHYSQFMVYDFDSDGKAEMIVRTADGSVDSKGKVIGNVNADFRESGIPDQTGRRRTINQGRILRGNEYLTVFSGLTGEALYTTDYIPERGKLEDWGDSRGNRSDRFLAGIAYLDGIHPSIVFSRGYYTRIVIAAFDWNGKELTNKWTFDTNNPENKSFAGQGNHNLSIGDVDGDGCDEIVFGSCAIDNNGKGLYSTQLGHGDAMHLTQFSPSLKGMQVWACHENKKDGSTFRDAHTGKILFQVPSNTDVGRCLAAEIDPTNPGLEMWSSASGGVRNLKGEIINSSPKGLPVNFAVWWDGDLQRELLDRNKIFKYNWKKKKTEIIATFNGALGNNGTKATPCLQADLLGDWREEVILRSEDNRSLRIYISTLPTAYRFHSFMQDIQYRISVATQNVGYNQPPQTSFYFGPELRGTFRGFKF